MSTTSPFSYHQETRLIVRVIQTSINRINEWTKSKGFKLSAEKTAAIKFEKRKKGMDPELTLNNNAIQVLESTRYLGLIVDRDILGSTT